MCGIAGYIGKNNIEKSRLRNTLDLMVRRGPDYQSFYSSKHENFNVFLLHSRLGILDLDERSNQPFSLKKYIYNRIQWRDLQFYRVKKKAI